MSSPSFLIKVLILYLFILQILSWEFCARRHEEFLLRRLVAPQVQDALHPEAVEFA